MRAALLFSVSVLGLAACASSTPAPIDYRAGGDPARAAVPPRGAAPIATATTVPAAPRLPSVSVPSSAPPAGQAARPSSSPAVQEAALLAPEMSPRPGGPLRQPKDKVDARAVQVQAGDSVYDISRRHSVNMRALIETNALEAPYTLNPGQTVMLPPPNIHVVERGETLYAVSRRYNIDTRSLALMNGLERPWTVWPGDEILLPPLARDQGREIAPPIATPVAVTPAPSPVSPPSSQIASAPPVRMPPVLQPAPAAASPGAAGPIALTPAASAAPKEVVSAVAGGNGFIWPVSGKVLSGFGVGANGMRNDGVDISVAPGTEVKAAAAGEVVYAGNELTGFGNLVLIRHPEGWVTAYAHSERMLVKEGDRVTQGQPIAVAGARRQIHFELRRGKDPVDPAQQLPAAS